MAQAISPTERMRPNNGNCSRTRSVGRKPAPPASTTAAMPSVAPAITAAKAMPEPASPCPPGSISAQASGG